MGTTTDSLITAFDYVWDRLGGRLSGLTDEEYFWEPVAGCWSLRQNDQGRWLLDGGGGGPAPDPAPLTTIAWRLGGLSPDEWTSPPRSRLTALRASCCYLGDAISAET